MRMTETVKQLLIINIIFYIGSNFVGDVAYQLFSGYYPENPNFRFWQPFTRMFMHAPIYGGSDPGNLMHLIMNMFGLVMFGSVLEQLLGAKKFIFYYISCGILAGLFSYSINFYYFHHGIDLLVESGENKMEILKILSEGKYNLNWQNIIPLEDFNKFLKSYSATSMGASGALYGLMVGFAYLFPEARMGLFLIPIEIKAKYFVPGLIFVDVVLGFYGSSIFGTETGIGHFAHIGGALFGFIMMWYWKKNSFNNNRWD